MSFWVAEFFKFGLIWVTVAGADADDVNDASSTLLIDATVDKRESIKLLPRLPTDEDLWKN